MHHIQKLQTEIFRNSKSLSVNDGTLDEYIQLLADEIALDWESDDWGGIFGIMFSHQDEYSREEARKIFNDAVRIYSNDT